MIIQKKVKLAPYTTFKIGGPADYFGVVKNVEELKEAVIFAQAKKLKIFVLGGGANVLFADSGFRGLVIKNEIKGKQVKINGQNIYLTVGGGEDWIKLVDFTVKNKYYGLENLALIPGTVGAAPMQNIGAYGVELKDVFYKLSALNLKTLKVQEFNLSACDFAYRHSVFKTKLKNKFFILSVTLKLSKKFKPILGYGALSDYLQEQGIKKPRALDVLRAVKAVRRSKLPDPQEIPSAGSFFKNPEITPAKFKKILAKFPEIKSFSAGAMVKIPAGWLIENAGFKGKIKGKVAVYPYQSLVIINRGGARAKEVLSLAQEIQKVVKRKFSITLEMEVNKIA